MLYPAELRKHDVLDIIMIMPRLGRNVKENLIFGPESLQKNGKKRHLLCLKTAWNPARY